jgi:hypothetical protein
VQANAGLDRLLIITTVDRTRKARGAERRCHRRP